MIFQWPLCLPESGSRDEVEVKEGEMAVCTKLRDPGLCIYFDHKNRPGFLRIGRCSRRRRE